MIIFQTHLSDYAEHWMLLFGGGAGTAAVLKALNYVSKQMPPLKPGAGWWTTLFYNLMKGASLHDPTYNAKPTTGAQ